MCAHAVCGHLATDIVRASNIGSSETVITSSVVTTDHCTQGFDSDKTICLALWLSRIGAGQRTFHTPCCCPRCPECSDNWPLTRTTHRKLQLHTLAAAGPRSRTCSRTAACSQPQAFPSCARSTAACSTAECNMHTNLQTRDLGSGDCGVWSSANTAIGPMAMLGPGVPGLVVM